MSNQYKVLERQRFFKGDYSLVPIRVQDRFEIMKWRNEQIYHLRQNKKLTEEDQNRYFKNVIAKLFEENNPDQILFSYLKGDKCIGYGGLVYINWIDKNAEVSFVMDTRLEKEHFEFHWNIYLELLENVAFEELNLRKIFTYAFDLRPKLYSALENAGFKHEATLEQHCIFEGKFKNVVIHSKINDLFISYRHASLNDARILFNWANDYDVRNNSFNPEPILWEDHLNWLKLKLDVDKSKIFIFSLGETPIGQVRLDFEEEHWTIDFSVDKKFRGKGYGKRLLKTIINETSFSPLYALVKEGNIGSYKTFTSLSFTLLGKKEIDQKSLFEFIN